MTAADRGTPVRALTVPMDNARILSVLAELHGGFVGRGWQAVALEKAQQQKAEKKGVSRHSERAIVDRVRRSQQRAAKRKATA